MVWKSRQQGPPRTSKVGEQPIPSPGGLDQAPGTEATDPARKAGDAPPPGPPTSRATLNMVEMARARDHQPEAANGQFAPTSTRPWASWTSSTSPSSYIASRAEGSRAITLSS
eukprot:8422134-Heterocapsa_arctica.AAC.1